MTTKKKDKEVSALNDYLVTISGSMIVIVTIGLSLKIATPSFLNLMNKTRELEGAAAVNTFIKAGKRCHLYNNNLPRNAGELSQCVSIPACQWAAHIKGTQICKEWEPLKLGRNNPNTRQWNSPSGLFNITMNVSWPRLLIRAIPYFSNTSGTSGCYNSKTGSIEIRSFKPNPSFYRSGKRRVRIGIDSDVPRLQC